MIKKSGLTDCYVHAGSKSFLHPGTLHCSTFYDSFQICKQLALAQNGTTFSAQYGITWGQVQVLLSWILWETANDAVC